MGEERKVNDSFTNGEAFSLKLICAEKSVK
jgi:hypothetical protein